MSVSPPSQHPGNEEYEAEILRLKERIRELEGELTLLRAEKQVPLSTLQAQMDPK